MSDRHTKLAEGSAVVVATTPKLAFAERYVAAGFHLPDQKLMRRMMLMASYNLPWDAQGVHVLVQRFIFRTKRFAFVAHTLEDYAKRKDNTWGAPIPDEIKGRIAKVKACFPAVQVRIHAHVDEDPFVQYILDGQSLLTDAWLRKGNKLVAIYPPVR